jgi:hypothetical protein
MRPKSKVRNDGSVGLERVCGNVKRSIYRASRGSYGGMHRCIVRPKVNVLRALLLALFVAGVATLTFALIALAGLLTAALRSRNAPPRFAFGEARSRRRVAKLRLVVSRDGEASRSGPLRRLHSRQSGIRNEYVLLDAAAARADGSDHGAIDRNGYPATENDNSATVRRVQPEALAAALGELGELLGPQDRLQRGQGT